MNSNIDMDTLLEPGHDPIVPPRNATVSNNALKGELLLHAVADIPNRILILSKSSCKLFQPFAHLKDTMEIVPTPMTNVSFV